MNDATNWIAEAKAWARENYTNGADTMVECWDTSDYENVWAQFGNAADAWDVIKRVCAVYAERQADARSYREC